MSTEKDRTAITAPRDTRRQIEGLVQRFARNLDVYTRPAYRETQVRVEFIDPFFEALGWDVRNVQGYAEPYKDVIHKDAIKLSGATKAPDYCFRVGGARKFFLEARTPGPPSSPPTRSSASATSKLPTRRSTRWSMTCMG